MTSIAPEVLWAQRSSDSDPLKNIIYLTVNLTDPTELDIKLTDTTLDIGAVSDGKDYKLNIAFFKNIDEGSSKYNISGSHIFFILVKKDLDEEFWPRLTKEKVKYRNIKTDFERWVDEDEQDDVDDSELNKGADDLAAMGGNQGMDFSQLAQQFGGGFPQGGGLPQGGAFDPSQFDLKQFEENDFSSSGDDDEEENDEVKEVEEIEKKE